MSGLDWKKPHIFSHMGVRELLEKLVLAQNEWAHQYLDWDAESINGALERLANLGDPESLNRAHWFEVFNDYTKMTPQGQFVSLSMDEFDRLKNDQDLAPTRLPFLVLTLTAADVDAQAKILFRLFAQSQRVTSVEARTLLDVVINTLKILNVLPRADSTKSRRRSQHVLQPIDDDQRQRRRRSSTQEKVIDVDKVLRETFPALLIEASSFDETAFKAAWRAKQSLFLRSLLEAELLEKRPRRRSSLAKVEATTSQQRLAQAHRRFSAEAARKAVAKPFQAAIDEHRREGETMLDKGRKRVFKEHMQRVNRVASQTTLQELLLTTGLTYHELSEIRAEFAAVFANVRACNDSITVGRLKSVLLARYPSLNDGRVLTRLAKVFDKNKNGSVDFAEFVTGLVKFVTPRKERDLLELVFALFDKNGDGSVELWEICDLVETAQHDLRDMCAYARDKTNSLDLNGDGTISIGEFIYSVDKDGVYRNFLWSSLPLLPPRLYASCLVPVVDAVRASAQLDGKDVVAQLLTVLEDLRTDLVALTNNSKSLVCDYDTFWHSMAKILRDDCVTDRVKEGLNVIFSYFAGDYFANTPEQRAALGLRVQDHKAGKPSEPSRDTPVCNIRRPWSVITRQCVGDSNWNKARMLFALMKDVDDHPDTISVEEIESYLGDVTDLAESLTVNAVKLLDDLDKSGDGKLQMDELTSIVLDNPSCLHCMSALQICDLTYYEQPTLSPSRSLPTIRRRKTLDERPMLASASLGRLRRSSMF